ncbi:MAG: HoxN/HupN/NixA family nickel/cobalt transporter, partial [Legionellales bacterium]
AYLSLVGLSIKFPILLGLGLLAYVLGLKHGVDADHIIAIDNTTRKLMHEGKTPIANGFFFSLGHSMIVIAMVLVVAVASKAAFHYFYDSRAILGIIGTSVSASFLIFIGLLNLAILLGAIREYRKIRNNREGKDIMPKGFMNTIFAGVFKSIHSSWELLPIGILFGLGFDTATEVTLLGISATQAGNNIPILYILILPIMFAAGMMIVDSSDSVFMVRAYSWALTEKSNRALYNISITAISVLVAFFVAAIELLGLVPNIAPLFSRFDINAAGFIIVGIFILLWVGAFLFYRVRKKKKLGKKMAEKA